MTLRGRYATGQGKREEVLAAYDLWQADKQWLHHMADNGPVTVPAIMWGWHRDEGVELMHALAGLARGTDECGHMNADTVRGGKVECDDCGQTWEPPAVAE